jgi:hypothetical protein
MRHTLKFSATASNGKTGDSEFFYAQTHEYRGLNDAQHGMLVMNYAILQQLRAAHGPGELSVVLDGTDDGKPLAAGGVKAPVTVDKVSYDAMVAFQEHITSQEAQLQKLARIALSAGAKKQP